MRKDLYTDSYCRIVTDTDDNKAFYADVSMDYIEMSSNTALYIANRMKQSIKSGCYLLGLLDKIKHNKTMIEKINAMLKEMRSNYDTNDGLTLTSYIGNMTFLQKHFNSIIECYEYVLSVYNKIISK